MSDFNVRTDLFPQFFSITGMWNKRDYVQDQLVNLALRNDLFLTELMNQDPELIQHIGDVILGHALDDGRYGAGNGKHITHAAIPQELLDYRVKIKSAVVKGPDKETREQGTIWDGTQTIKYVDGTRPATTIMKGRGRNRRNVKQFEKNVIDLGVTEATVTLQQAWKILKQAGVGAKYIVSDRDLFKWKYEEVQPEPIESAPVPTTSRSRRKRPADMMGSAA